MHGVIAEAVGVVLLAASLAVAIARPRGASEALVAVPAAILVVATGIVPSSEAVRILRELGPTVGFLAAVLVLGRLCDDAGVFRYLGGWAARLGAGRPRRMLTVVVLLAAAVTAVLTLDATVVLVTPVVLAATARAGVEPTPHAYACARLANSGSLLLPVSNLTNLLAFGATGLSFGRFAALMALPWAVAVAGEGIGLQAFFGRALVTRPRQDGPAAAPCPRYALGVLAATVAAFVVFSTLHVAIAWAAVAGCVLLLIGGTGGRRRAVPVRHIVRAANPGFCAFVFAIAVVVEAVARHGLGTAVRHLLPGGHSVLALLGVAVVAAVLANAVNNLPATLVLLPLVAVDPLATAAMLIGVNVGPNATYAGSLATLLWRRTLPATLRPRPGEFHRFGLLTVAPILLAATAALWVSGAWLGLR
ncbi:MAG: arsenic transporter [Jatrophihabitans sp.]|nr:MAG: arsenic transporter [Jatrophihabitans sp.]